MADVNKQRDECIFVAQFSQNIGKCAVDSRNVCSGKCYSARLKSQLRRSEVEGNLALPISNSSLLLPLLFRTQHNKHIMLHEVIQHPVRRAIGLIVPIWWYRRLSKI